MKLVAAAVLSLAAPDGAALVAPFPATLPSQDAGCVQPVRTVAQLDSAVLATRSLLADAPASPDHRCRMAALHMQGGRYEQADSLLASLLAVDPGHLDALLTQAVLRRRQYRYGDAGRIVAQAAELTGADPVAADPETADLPPQRRDLALLRGRLALDAMDIARADSIYTGLLRTDPYLARAHLGAAEIAFWQHRSEDARDFLQSALTLDPHLASAHLLAARIHREAQENAEWRISVHRAVEVDSLSANAHAQLASVFRNDSAIVKAYHHAHFAIDLDPYAQGAHSYLGNGGSLLGYDSVPADPAEFDGRIGELLAEGDEHLLARRYEEAMGPFREVLAADPGNVVAFMGIGTAHYQLGDYEAALEWFERILADHPGYGLAHYGVAMALGRMRDRVIVGLDEMREVFARRDAPEPEGLREVFPDYERLDEELQKIVRLSVEPFSNFMPVLAARGATFHLLPFHKLLWQSPRKEHTKGSYTFDLRLWDDVKGQGGFHAVGGEEWVRGVRYQRWNVITHEFTHQVHQMLPEDLREEISRLYAVAKRERRTLDYYADFNEMEYFAQAAEAFISEVKFIDQRVTSGHTRALLAEKDPALFEFLSRLNERLARERRHEQPR
ncbi:MAG: tetratricopeptide repeat protein [Gemmatimonadetes bacterium]|nr:tetratricopeptide repeat protein [Gemmatimonadota bacterium]MYE69999.1 tetratricopeptide repeat protein [Gemmatimonadota bacterium]